MISTSSRTKAHVFEPKTQSPSSGSDSSGPTAEPSGVEDDAVELESSCVSLPLSVNIFFLQLLQTESKSSAPTSFEYLTSLQRDGFTKQPTKCSRLTACLLDTVTKTLKEDSSVTRHADEVLASSATIKSVGVSGI